MSDLKEELRKALSEAIKEQDRIVDILKQPYSDAYKWGMRREYQQGKCNGLAWALEILDVSEG